MIDKKLGEIPLDIIHSGPHLEPLPERMSRRAVDFDLGEHVETDPELLSRKLLDVRITSWLLIHELIAGKA